MEIGTMVVISKKSRRSARGQAGWVVAHSENGTRTTVRLRSGGEVRLETSLLRPANEGFQWPRGTQAQLSVYGEDHPQRIPTEAYFSESVQRNINHARSGEDYVNLWLLIDSLKGLNDPSVQSGFETWLWAIQSVLGDESCRNVGKTVCEVMGFTLEEAERLFKDDYRLSEAKRYSLNEAADWEKIHEVRQQARDAEELGLIP